MTLQASGLAFARGERILFEGLSFELQPGQALHLRGPNGSGKTSLLRVIAGLSQALHGQLSWRGKALAKQREAWLQSLLFCGHAPALKNDLLAWENLALAAQLGGAACSESQARAALSQIGLAAQARLPASVLSQGQRKRLSLARLFLLDVEPAQHLLLDEPFDALDDASILRLTRRLAQLLNDGSKLIYTTHQPQDLGEKVDEQQLDLQGRS